MTAKPWEKRQKKPWEKRQATISAAAPTKGRQPAPKILEEQHPKVSGWDRFKLLNFSQGPEASLRYLQKENPDLSLSLLDGRIVIKAPGEQNYRVIDPNTGFFSTDIVKDTGDVAVDIGRAIAGGAAQLLGAIGGGATGGVPGAYLGASAAGGAMDAATEALRQKMGAWLGIPQEVSGADVVTEGMFGATAPLLFGPGAKLGKGLLPAAYKKVTRGAVPKVAEITSGVRARDFKNFLKFDTEIKELSKKGVGKFSDDLGREVDNAYSTLVKSKTDELDELVKNSDTVFDVRPIKQVYATEINELNQRRVATGLTGDEAKYLKKLEKEYAGSFQKTLDTGEVVGTPDKVDGIGLYKIKKKLQEKANFYKKNEKLGDKALSDKAKQSIGVLNESMDSTVAGAKALRKELEDIGAKKQLIEDNFITRNKFTGKKEYATKTNRTLLGLERNTNEPLAEMLTKFDMDQGTNIIKKMEILKAQKALGTNAALPKSLQGTTSTSRTITNTAGLGTLGWYAGANSGLGAGGGRLGAGVGAALGLVGLSPAAWKNYMKAGLGTERFAKKAYDLIPQGPLKGVPMKARSAWNLMDSQGQ